MPGAAVIERLRNGRETEAGSSRTEAVAVDCGICQSHLLHGNLPNSLTSCDISSQLVAAIIIFLATRVASAASVSLICSSVRSFRRFLTPLPRSSFPDFFDLYFFTIIYNGVLSVAWPLTDEASRTLSKPR